MRVILTIALSLFISSTSYAVTYKIAAYEWEPFIDSKRADGGVYIEMIRKILASQGHSIKVETVPFARAIAMLQDGSADILPAIWHTVERENTMVYSDSYSANRLVFIKPKDSDFDCDGLPSLHGKKVGIIRGYGYGDDFLNDPNIKFSISKSLESNV